MGLLAGVIKNEGQLVAPAGQRVVLAGGLVVNTGVIETAHGQVIVTASPGGRYVEVMPAGSVLSFSVPVATESAIAVQNLRPLRWEDVVSLATGTVYVSGTVSTASQVRNPDSIINITGEKVVLDRANLSNVGTDGLIQIRVAPGVETQGYVFVDRVRNYEQLVNALSPGHDLFLINPTDSGVEKVNQVVARSGAVPRMDIVGDGNAGQIWFGRDFITLDTLPQYEAQIAQWGQGLTGSREIFLYACNLAASQAGKELVGKISELTNSTVAASTDITGHSQYGGNWQFEYSTGHLTSQMAFNPQAIETADVKLTTFTVTDFGDNLIVNGQLTLREAIQAANTNAVVDGFGPGSGAVADEIKFAAPGTITLALGELVVNDPAGLIITGLGAGNTKIDGGGVDRVFNVTAGDITFNDVTIRNGDVIGNGGGIFATGNVTLNKSEVSGNTASQDGGGIFSNGTVTLTNSTVSDNTAGQDGGGIFANANAQITDSVIENNEAGNSGGGIFNAGGSVLTITNSKITGNEASVAGGGIFNGSGSDLTISASKITENEASVAGGGIFNDGTLTLKNVTVADNGQNSIPNDGGGLANKAGATATIENSTFRGNVANNGGGIDNQGTLTVTNSTLGENEANLEGGGLRNLGGTATLKNVTIVGNKVTLAGGQGGGGIFNDPASTVTISNSIVAGNEDLVNGATKNEVVNQGTFTISGKNLVGQNGNLGGFPADPSNIVVPGGVIGVQVGPLQNNGGLTETFALLPGSLAINASGAGATTSDQRGVAAVGIRDIGAFEFVPPVVPPVVPVPPVTVAPGGEPLPLSVALGRLLTQEQERLLFQPYLCVGEVLLPGAPPPPLPACVQSVNVRPSGELFDLLRN